jgi:hypothetical protein
LAIARALTQGATWTNQAIEKDDQLATSASTPQYLPGDTVVMQAAGDLRKGITVNGKLKQMCSRYRWRGRRGKTLRVAADALILKTGDQDGVRAAFEQVLERQV